MQSPPLSGHAGIFKKYNYMQLFPFLTVFGLRRLRTAIRLVRFGYDTFIECVV